MPSCSHDRLRYSRRHFNCSAAAFFNLQSFNGRDARARTQRNEPQRDQIRRLRVRFIVISKGAPGLARPETISVMDETTIQRLRKAQEKFELGERAGALNELQDLRNALDDPVDKARVLYQEMVLLFDGGELATARIMLEDLKVNAAVGATLVLDSDRPDPRVVLAIMILFAEAKLLLEAGDKAGALQALENAMARYPKQLSLSEVRENSDELYMLRGFLLADDDRWLEAIPFLESVSAGRIHELVAYYLGHCYYQLRRFNDAKTKLIESLNDGLALDANWRARAHYELGLTEYELSEMREAKHQFEMCVRTADPEFLRTTKVWEWLEATSSSLGLHEEAQGYRKRMESPRRDKPN